MTADVYPVTDVVRRFAEEYLIDFKIGKAAERAGISPSYASEVMKDPRVQALINEGKRRASGRVNVSVDNVLENLRIMTTVTIADFMDGFNLKPVDEWTDEMRQSVKSLKWTKFGPALELHDALAANVHIGKHLGMFVDRVALSGPGGGPIPTINGTMTPQEAAEAYAKTLEAG